MHRVGLEDVPVSTDQGVTTHLLYPGDDLDGDGVTIWWVTVEDGRAEEPHTHPVDKVYTVIRGEGIFHVGSEETTVEVGDLVHVPSRESRWLENTGADGLVYVCAATPAIPSGRKPDEPGIPGQIRGRRLSDLAGRSTEGYDHRTEDEGANGGPMGDGDDD